MYEDLAVFDGIEVSVCLEGLSEERRVVLELVFGLKYPDDWNPKVPVTLNEIGRYFGNRFRGAPIGEASVRHIRDVALQEIRDNLKKTARNGRLIRLIKENE